MQATRLSVETYTAHISGEKNSCERFAGKPFERIEMAGCFYVKDVYGLIATDRSTNFDNSERRIYPKRLAQQPRYTVCRVALLQHTSV